MSQSRGAESAPKDRPPQCGKTGEGKLAHLRQVRNSTDWALALS